MTVWRLLEDVRALLLRERALITAVAAPFLFLPLLAIRLLTPPLPGLPETRTQATVAAWWDSMLAWSQANGGWYLLADAIAVYGAATLTILLAGPARPTVADALARAARVWPRFLIASALVAVPVGLGMWLLLLPGLFLQSRFVVASAALVLEPVSAAGALARSWRITARANGPVFATVALLFGVQALALIPLAPLDEWLRTPGHLNPFVLALVDGGMAAIAAIYEVALVVLGIVTYRRLAS